MKTIDILPTTTGSSGDRNSFRLLNSYNSEGSVKSIHGTETYFDPTNYGVADYFRVRCLHVTGRNRLFSVIGEKLIEVVDELNARTSTQPISNGGWYDDSRITMADNGKYVLITDGVSLNICDTDDAGLHTVSYGVPVQYVSGVVQFNERFFIINNDPNEIENRSKVYWSEVGVEGCKTWLHLNYWGLTNGEQFKSIKATQEYLYLFTDRSYYVFSKSTNADLPIHKVGGNYGNIGVNSLSSVAQYLNTVFWLGSSDVGERQIFRLDGLTITKISDSNIDNLLHSIKHTEDAVGWCYTVGGESFYVLNFPTDNRTLVYNSTSNSWHERSTINPQTGLQEVYHAQYATNWKGTVYVGSSLTNNILTFNRNKFSEFDGRNIQKLIQTKVLSSNTNYLFHSKLVIDADVQTWNNFDNKYFMLQYSDDGGNTWNYERTTDLPNVGEYSRRVEYRLLGRSRERVYRISTDSQVSLSINGIALDVTEGTR